MYYQYAPGPQDFRFGGGRLADPFAECFGFLPAGPLGRSVDAAFGESLDAGLG